MPGKVLRDVKIVASFAREPSFKVTVPVSSFHLSCES